MKTITGNFVIAGSGATWLQRPAASGIRHPASGIRYLASGIVLILCLFITSTAFPQDESNGAIDPHEPGFREQFNHVDFGGNLALRVAGDTTNNYFILDLTRFNSKFDKVWFIYRIFHEEKPVLIDSDISSDRLWFSANRRYNENDVLDLFLKLKLATDEVSGRMTEEEKGEWMKTNDKYK